MTNDELADAVASLNELHATANITEMYLIIRQLWAEREDMEKEMLEQCRIIGAGGERELALLAKVEEQRREIEKVVADYDWLRKTLNKRIGRFDEATGTLTLVQCENCESNRAAMVKAKEAVHLGKELSSWVGSINWRGGENLQPWLDDLSAKMTAFDAARGEALAALESVGV